MRAAVRIKMLPTAELHVSKLNPRRGPGDISELAASIKQIGLLPPLVVTPNGSGYLVLAGQRRLAAAKRLRLPEIPCVVRRMSERDREIAMLSENVQRVNLSPIEEATVYVRLMKLHDLNQTQVGEVCGVSAAKVSQHLALLRLPKDVVQRVDSGEMPISEALGVANYRSSNPKPLMKPRGLSVSLHTVEAHERCKPDRCGVRALLDLRQR